MQVLSLNAGSSSLKVGLYEHQNDELVLIANVHIDELKNTPTLKLDLANGYHESYALTLDPNILYSQAFHQVLLALDSHCQLNIHAIGHRIVHGGSAFAEPVLIAPEILTQLYQLSPLAPLHQPVNLALVEVAQAYLPQVLHIACFDTAFHSGHNPLFDTYGLPQVWTDQGIRGYGFHGLSCQSIVRQFGKLHPEIQHDKLIIAHLGSGASVTAVEEGKSVATSMGFSAAEGLMMGTRCGQIDAGIILHLMRQGLSIDDVDYALNHESGLLGVSNESSDMRQLLASQSKGAQFAIELFCYRAAKNIASLLAALHGLEHIVFTAGIGTHTPLVRSKIIRHLAWLGIDLDTNANEDNAMTLHTEHSRVKVWCFDTDEEYELAIGCLPFLK